uniref:NGF domain-containing protein n=2 Tax=Caenorhabditis japonica TaxID=281687 RepID=A0A8R1EPQ6_CAEJA
MIVALLLCTAFDVKKAANFYPEQLDQVYIKKKSILVGMSEETEEVCETVIHNGYRPAQGHLVNGSLVEILQQSIGHQFRKTFVRCKEENRPTCNGVKDNLYTSECVTVYENVNTMVRLFGSSARFELGTIRVPIQCECRLRRHYRIFESLNSDYH